ncbi:hypothetical protein [Winogradskyella helgolandensis]|uniref:hypothetical protein n=1 Tax=Winogradskyella helgolandensis TaxID=2697010 RepID=UPI0015BE2290|nr:hypothetical protein [Winogradskyella helgolandensis]
MEDFLRRIKLIDTFSTTLNVSRSEFISALRHNIDEGDIDGVFSGAFEAFTSSKNRYIGSVDYHSFRIRLRKRAFQRNFRTIASGELKEEGDFLVINTKINAWRNDLYVLMAFMVIFYLSLFTFLIWKGFLNNLGFGIFIMMLIIMHAFFVFVVPFLVLQKSVRMMKIELEREFHYIISKSSSLK